MTAADQFQLTFGTPVSGTRDHLLQTTEPPLRGCHCGSYIMRDLTSLMQAIQGLDLKGNPVLGVVTGWGKTVEHRLSWRCQYASIVGLLNEPPLAREYQVDSVADETELRELAEWASGRAAHPRLQDYLREG